MKHMRRQRRYVLQPDIGLAPLIDTAFTLLIVFMVAAPALQYAIKVDLPRGSVQEGEKQNQEFIISVDKKGTIFFNSRPVTFDTLEQAVRLKIAPFSKKGGASIWLRMDGRTTMVDTLTRIMSSLKKIDGIRDVKIETEYDRKNIA